MALFAGRGCASVVLALAAFFSGCAGPSPADPLEAASRAMSSFQPILSGPEIAVVQQTFPEFEPELFRSGVVASTLTPDNFSPALFFGDPKRQGMRPTPGGVMVETSGFDQPTQPDFLPPQGTYFDRQGTSFVFDLGTAVLDPLSDLESRMGYAPSSDGPKISVDLRQARLDPAKVDLILSEVQRAVAVRLPEAAKVDPRLAEVVIAPSIFYVRRSNLGDTWAGGLTEPLGNGRYRLTVVVFYIDGKRSVNDWREFLVSEAINFYVLAVGRSDLAR